jgi:hypothetical protein
LFGTALLVNTLRGRSATVSVRTAVQSYRLPGLNRWRKATRFLAEVKPRIAAAQAAPVENQSTS